MHEPGDPFVPAPRSAGEELVDDGAADRLEAIEPFRRPPAALVEDAGERVGVLHCESGAGADGKWMLWSASPMSTGKRRHSERFEMSGCPPQSGAKTASQ